MPPRTYEHAGRRCEAMRFVGNGPEVEKWAGPLVSRAVGAGLSGSLRVNGAMVEMGDWVVCEGAVVTVVRQEVFPHQFKEVRHADFV